MTVDVVLFVAALVFMLAGGARIGWALAVADRRLSGVVRDELVCIEADRQEES